MAKNVALQAVCKNSGLFEHLDDIVKPEQNYLGVAQQSNKDLLNELKGKSRQMNAVSYIVRDYTRSTLYSLRRSFVLGLIINTPNIDVDIDSYNERFYYNEEGVTIVIFANVQDTDKKEQSVDISKAYITLQKYIGKIDVSIIDWSFRNAEDSTRRFKETIKIFITN